MFVLQILFLAGGALLLAYDARRLLRAMAGPDPRVYQSVTIRWAQVRIGALAGILLVLCGLAIHIVPNGMAGVRVSQFGGTENGTLYPGVHFALPLIEDVELFDIRDRVPSETLKVQTKDGLLVTLTVGVRYRLDPRRLSYINANLPRPIDKEIVSPAIASTFREVVPNYMTNEIFALRREEVRRTASGLLTKQLAGDGIVVREVILRDLVLPAEYAKGLEGLLLKAQQNDRLALELEVKQKEVKVAELEAEAAKARQIKEAEGEAQVFVLQAKAQADAMQFTLPLKEKQIEQTRLEAEARKEATIKNAEAASQAKVIDARAELEKRKLLNEADEHRTRLMAAADTSRMKLEAEMLRQNPLPIQKIIAGRLSDKVQIMMAPNDGKFFFAKDVLMGPRFMDANRPPQ